MLLMNIHRLYAIQILYAILPCLCVLAVNSNSTFDQNINNTSFVFLTATATSPSDLVLKSEALDDDDFSSLTPSFTDDCKAEIKEHCSSDASSDAGTDDFDANDATLHYCFEQNASSIAETM